MGDFQALRSGAETFRFRSSLEKHDLRCRVVFRGNSMEEHVSVTDQKASVVLQAAFLPPVWPIVSLVLSLKQPDDIKKHLSGFRSSCRQSWGGGL